MAHSVDDPYVNIVAAASEVAMAADAMYSLFGSSICESVAKADSSGNSKSSSKAACITVSKVDDAQKQVAINGWGHLNRTKTMLEKVLRGSMACERGVSDLNKLCLDEIYRLRRQLLKESKKNALLKDLLVNELNRSEAVETQMSNTNDIMNTMASTIALVKRRYQSLEDDHRKVKSRLTKLEEGSSNQSIDGSVVTNDDEQEPEPSYIGRYIYKSFPPDGHFVGFVVSFKKPYYKVVYEDGDMEDMVRKEVLHYWVSESNLSAQKKILCQRSAKAVLGTPAAIPPKQQRVQLK